MDNIPENPAKVCKPKIPPKPLFDGEINRTRRLKSLPGRMHIQPGEKPPLLPKPQGLKMPSPFRSQTSACNISSPSSSSDLVLTQSEENSIESCNSVFETFSTSSSENDIVIMSETSQSDPREPVRNDSTSTVRSINCERFEEGYSSDNTFRENSFSEWSELEFEKPSRSIEISNETAIEVDGSKPSDFQCEDIVENLDSVKNVDIVVDLKVNLLDMKSDEKGSTVGECAPDVEVDCPSTDSSCGSFTVIAPTADACPSAAGEAPVQSFLHSLNCIRKTHKQKPGHSDETLNDSNLETSSVTDEPSSSKLLNSSSLYKLESCKKRDSIEFNQSPGSWGEDSEVESTDGLRRKLTSWFGSFGKGNKNKDKRESCLFYCDNENDVTIDNDDETRDESHCPRIEIVENADNDNLPPEKYITEDFDKVNSSIGPDCVSAGCSNLLASEAFDVENNRSSMSEESFEIAHNRLNNEENESARETHSERKHRKAFFVARELMTSEKVFIEVLKLLCFDFKEYIKQCNKDLKCCVIPEEEFDRIISSLPQLLRLSEDLFQDLESRMQNWDILPKISDILVKKGPFLKLCSVYIQNFEAQCNYLDDCCQKYPRFAKAVESFEHSDRCKKLTLKHYMLKPVQRIPQYRMLLDDYLSHLDESSPDFTDTQTALQIVSDVANHANKSIKNLEHLGKLLQIQAQLGNYELIKPSRRFIKEGELCKLSRKESQLRYFILLNDCLLYTTFYGSMTGFRVKYELPLSGMKVTMPQSEDCRTEFSIITSTRSFTLRAKSAEECNDWVVTLQNAIKDNISRQSTFINLDFSPKNINAESIKLGKEAPIWIQDKKVTMCQSCTAEFTVTFRRHHCRACGKVVCSNCSDNKAPLQYLKFQSARVCDDCHTYLIKEFEDRSNNILETIKTVLKLEDEEAVSTKAEYIHSLFKKQPATMKKTRKYVPQRLKEVTANGTGSQMSGSMYMQGLYRGRSWKKRWFVLKEQVLYIYKAQEDVAALRSMPVLGYKVETVKDGSYDDSELRFMFQLSHVNQHPLVFAVDSQHTASRWIAAFEEATILK